MSSQDVEVSVVIPCLNEEKGIGVCIEKIKKVFNEQNINGEIIVSDNGSTDKSVEISRNLGARVINQSVKGYGAAYIKGLSEAKGRYIVIADGDDTYNFLDLPKFIKPLYEGFEFVIGNRLKGNISKKAMPWANRYIGNPTLSVICQIFFGTVLSDIYCGMRSFTKEAYEKMNLKCLGMEFAIEMVMESLQKKLKIKEITIDYYARKGESKLRPFKDAWRALRLMLLFCPMWLYFVPGFFLAAFGIVNLFLLASGPFLFLGHYWDIHMMVFSSLMSILGYQIINLGMFAKTFAVHYGYLATDRTISFFTKNFNLELGLLVGFLFFIFGFSINLFIFIEWWQKLFGSLHRFRESILAMTFMVLGLQTIFSSFFLSLLVIRR